MALEEAKVISELRSNRISHKSSNDSFVTAMETDKKVPTIADADSEKTSLL